MTHTAEKDAPRIVTRTIVETWEPVAGPHPCQCGHLHYGRVRHSNEAPQWHICETDCGCTSLRPIPPEVRVCRTCGHGMTDQEYEDWFDQCEPCVLSPAE